MTRLCSLDGRHLALANQKPEHEARLCERQKEKSKERSISLFTQRLYDDMKRLRHCFDFLYLIFNFSSRPNKFGSYYSYVFTVILYRSLFQPTYSLSVVGSIYLSLFANLCVLRLPRLHRTTPPSENKYL